MTSKNSKKIASRSSLADKIAKIIVKPFHSFIIANRRVEILSCQIAKFLPDNQGLTGLDVGCGSGEVAKLIQTKKHNLHLTGVDVLVRKDAMINVIEFDGKVLPFADKSFDFTMLIDVLHHTDNPAILLEECVRVSRKFIIIKDHKCESWYDRIRLNLMDWIGNRAYGVYLPYNFLSNRKWHDLYSDAQLSSELTVSKLNLYPQPLSFVFDSTLHFVSKLEVPDVSRET
ncbi:class I SAM-dependent methyltransferase [Nostoc sp. FACHB-280]|uniref:class I SAM-dependent methyltransferase n=1 Tax=Nostoc sp. FACHB-280 TaxID=2692839 RepID=UPI00168B5A75|nr:class I SAM-dependent methyltransferase [Nostoc sp. FACHB-280]MBD2494565.1 class I SAM-dependent methyltransferase [Nostoc sp. FACHB-280]